MKLAATFLAIAALVLPQQPSSVVRAREAPIVKADANAGNPQPASSLVACVIAGEPSLCADSPPYGSVAVPISPVVMAPATSPALGAVKPGDAAIGIYGGAISIPRPAAGSMAESSGPGAIDGAASAGTDYVAPGDARLPANLGTTAVPVIPMRAGAGSTDVAATAAAINATLHYTPANAANFPGSSSNVQGSGFPGTDASNAPEMWFYNLLTQPTYSNHMHTLEVQSNEAFSGCAAGNTVAACPGGEVATFNVYNTVGKNVLQGEDAARFTLDNSLSANYFGIGVGVYAIAEKGAGSTWASVEVNYDYDHSGNSPTAARIGKELDIYGYGTDPGNLRLGLQIRGGYSFNDQNAAGFQPGVTLPRMELGTALDIGTPVQQGIIKTAISIHGYTGTGINLSGAQLAPGYSGYAISSPRFTLDWSGNAVINTVLAASYIAVGASGDNLTTDANNLYFDSVQANGFSWRAGTSATQIATLDKYGNFAVGASFNASGTVAATGGFSGPIGDATASTGKFTTIAASSLALTSGAVVPSIASSAPAIDARGTALNISVATGSNGCITGSGGLFVVEDATNNNSAVYAGDAANGLFLLGGNGAFVAPTTTPGAGKSSVAYSGVAVCIYNNTGSTTNYRMASLATR